jgi:hypothetical protein
MSFLQKVMFDERMTPLEYEFFNAIWRVAGVTPDNYEIVMMVGSWPSILPFLPSLPPPSSFALFVIVARLKIITLFHFLGGRGHEDIYGLSYSYGCLHG